MKHINTHSGQNAELLMSKQVVQRATSMS